MPETCEKEAGHGQGICDDVGGPPSAQQSTALISALLAVLRCAA